MGRVAGRCHHGYRAAPTGAARFVASRHLFPSFPGEVMAFLFLSSLRLSTPVKIGRFRRPKIGHSGSTRERTMNRIFSLAMLLCLLVGCRGGPADLEVELTTQTLEPGEVDRWPFPAVESAQPEIVVRQVFTAQGPCRELHAEFLPRFPGEFLLRVVAEDRSPCPSTTPHIGYTAVLSGMPAGRHQLRVVHVGADGRTLADVALEHPIIVTDPTTESGGNP